MQAVASKRTGPSTTHLLGGDYAVATPPGATRDISRTWHTGRTAVPLQVTTPLALVTTRSSGQSRWPKRPQPCPCCPCPPPPQRRLPLPRPPLRGLRPPGRQGFQVGPAASLAASPLARRGVPGTGPSRFDPVRCPTSSGPRREPPQCRAGSRPARPQHRHRPSPAPAAGSPCQAAVTAASLAGCTAKTPG